MIIISKMNEKFGRIMKCSAGRFLGVAAAALFLLAFHAGEASAGCRITDNNCWDTGSCPVIHTCCAQCCCDDNGDGIDEWCDQCCWDYNCPTCEPSCPSNCGEGDGCGGTCPYNNGCGGIRCGQTGRCGSACPGPVPGDGVCCASEVHGGANFSCADCGTMCDSVAGNAGGGSGCFCGCSVGGVSE
jgi:hypothetical protein